MRALGLPHLGLLPSHRDGSYEIVKGLKITPWLQERMKKSEASAPAPGASGPDGPDGLTDCPWMPCFSPAQEELLNERGCVTHLLGEYGGVCVIKEDTMLPGEA